MYRPRYECTKTICGDTADMCDLRNATEFGINPDPFRRNDDYCGNCSDVCLNNIEMVFLLVTGILTLSGLLLAYRWKSMVERLGIEEEVTHIRKSVTTMNTSVTESLNILMRRLSQNKCCQFLSLRKRAYQTSSASSVFINDHDNNTGEDLGIKVELSKDFTSFVVFRYSVSRNDHDNDNDKELGNRKRRKGVSFAMSSQNQHVKSGNPGLSKDLKSFVVFRNSKNDPEEIQQTISNGTYENPSLVCINDEHDTKTSSEIELGIEVRQKAVWATIF